jgi:protease IV
MNFLKTFLASFLGTIIGISFLILILFVAIISTSGEAEPYIHSNTVLKMQLGGTIEARTAHDPFSDLFPAAAGRQVSLEMLKNNLDKAAADDRISGVWIEFSRLATSWANLETAYKYLQEFRDESGKFIYASSNDLGMNESAYLLASVADSIFLPPEIYFEFNGFVIQISYMKNMLEKIGVEPEISRVGEYKSAVEPFLREDSSPENREQIMAILNSASETFIDAIENNRGLSRVQINELMNQIPPNSVQWALEAGLIDAIAHPHDVEDAIKNRLELEEDATLRTVSLQRYNRVQPRSAGMDLPDTSDRIAVIYASGMILPADAAGPFASGSVITANSIKQSLESSLENDDVKAIVIHINSGGGAISTSELILGQIREASKEKPVIAYLGNVAASGGYYIAMGADAVVASPNTITGSIGIYNQLFNTQEFYNDKLGIYFEEFKTHDHADIGLMTRPLTPSEREAMQRNVESGYETFLNRVADGRNMSRDEVHEVAQGRIWTGSDAEDIDLVDLTGTLDDAIALAAERAEIDEYRLIRYPERKELFEMLFSSAEVRVSNWVRSFIPYSEEIQTVHDLMNHNSGRNWAIMPIEFIID